MSAVKLYERYKKLKIAICYDNLSESKRTEQFLYIFSASHNSKDINIRIFNSSCELFGKISCSERYDIYILDIMMPNISGIDIGEQIRKNDEYAFIIYLTSSESYALKAFQVRAFQYVAGFAPQSNICQTLARPLWGCYHACVANSPMDCLVALMQLPTRSNPSLPNKKDKP